MTSVCASGSRPSVGANQRSAGSSIVEVIMTPATVSPLTSSLRTRLNRAMAATSGSAFSALSAAAIAPSRVIATGSPLHA